MGVVEITPEREYMIVMEFFDDAVELGDAEVDDAGDRPGTAADPRRMWDVRAGPPRHQAGEPDGAGRHLKLIDVFFVQVRPSPWRQAVDLANMMLVLALRTDAPRVYEHALRYFTPEEIARGLRGARAASRAPRSSDR